MKPGVRHAPRSHGAATGLPAAWELVRLAALEWWKDNTPRYAAALAFYTLFSIAPIILIAVGVVGFFYVPAEAERDVIGRVRQLVGIQGAQAVQQVLEASKGLGNNSTAVAVGVITFIFGASVVFGELQAALNAIWDVRPNRETGMFLKVIANRIRSFAIALMAGFLLVFSLFASTVIHNLKTYSTDRLPGSGWVWHGTNDVVSFLVIVVLFAMIYKYLPDVRLHWRDVWVGSFVTAVLFVAGKEVIGIYLGHAAVASAFGAAGSLAVLLVWVYYSALISFFGAEFTQVYAMRRGRKIQPWNHAIRAGRKKEKEA